MFFSTYFGGSGSENAATETAGSIALDANGNVYVAGDTVVARLPDDRTPSSRVRRRPNNPADGFVAKFSATGALVFSSYLGGRTSITSTAWRLPRTAT